MAWKKEKLIWKFNIPRLESERFYAIARQYCSINDITKSEREDERVSYYLNLKNKNISRLRHDIQIAIICGLERILRKY